MDPPPFKICKIEKNSPAAKAGLKLNDILISVNGKSVSGTSYEETISIIKEELQRKVVQLLVKHPTTLAPKRNAAGSLSSTSGNSSTSVGNTGGSETDEPSHRGANAVQQYQSE
jgi:predicted metalloprotease with PDZ domain